jgi:16S rRNA (cytidine1402-2'-O)-methyltransferase
VQNFSATTRNTERFYPNRLGPGALYVVATPIGNLEDITLRALHILKAVELVACEDTRHTSKLLSHFGIHKPLLSYHEHNEAARSRDIVDRLLAGESVALVTDAGTPLVSDPGYRLVAAAIEAGIKVIPLPGPSAAVAALSASGLPTDACRFGGFLPARSTQRRKVLASLAADAATLVFYEAPHRILETLADVRSTLGNRRVVIARELTKMHEEFLRGTIDEVAAALAARPSIKGEITLLIAKADEPAAIDAPIREAVEELERAGLSRMEAIKRVARQRGLAKRDVYRHLASQNPARRRV